MSAIFPYVLVLSPWLLVCSVGCRSNADQKLPTHPVTGRLTIDGAPAAGAMVKFYTRGNNGRVPTAVVRENGDFSASYYDTEDGAPEGDYLLLVIWMVDPPQGGLPVDRLLGQFCDPNQPAAMITVRAERNELGTINLRTRGSR